jgi:signal peptidase I
MENSNGAGENQNQNQPKQTGESALQSVGAFVWDLVKILVIALIIIIPFRTYVAEPFVVSGSSMLPNFQNNDYLIVNRLTYLTGNPQRGDVIVLKFPKDPSQFFIKRVIGLPGDKICFSPDCKASDQDGHVYIFNAANPNGFKLNEPYISQQTIGDATTQPLGTDEYFVMGDNRGASSDSRFWGILPRDLIVGKVWLRVFPFSEFGVFHTPTY